MQSWLGDEDDRGREVSGEDEGELLLVAAGEEAWQWSTPMPSKPHTHVCMQIPWGTFVSEEVLSEQGPEKTFPWKAVTRS